MKYLPLLAALALVGCADEAAETETPLDDAPAEVVTPPADDLEELDIDDEGLTEGEVLDDAEMMDDDVVDDDAETEEDAL